MMFDLKRPCVNCPFRVSVAGTFLLGADRVTEIVRATAFQCHKTVAYDQWDDPVKRQGEKPQQCAGLMALLHRAAEPNAIMQVGERTGYFDPAGLVLDDTFASIADAVAAHTWPAVRFDGDMPDMAGPADQAEAQAA